MSQIPLHHHNVSSLEEDLRVLNLLPSDAQPLFESKKAKKSKDADEEDYDYGDEMKDENVDSDVEEEDEDLDFENGPAEIEEAARAVLNAFNSLDEDEIDDLDETYIEAVQNAAEVLGVDLDLEEDEDDLEEAGRTKAQRDAATKAGNKNDAASNQRRKDAKKARRKNHAQKQTKRNKWRNSSKGKASIKRSRKRQHRDDGNIDNIIERLRGLTSPLAQESREVGVISDKIVEGLKSLHMNAISVSTGIAGELAEEDHDKSDPRYGLGVWFEGIAEDTKGILDRIFEHGDVPVEDAIEDLQALTSDFKKGLAKADRIA